LSYFARNGNDEVSNTAGSAIFFAPEVCQGGAYKGKRSDVWAAGVTLYFMIFKKYPFNARNKDDLF
jgi:serine/threonine protein kinase